MEDCLAASITQLDPCNIYTLKFDRSEIATVISNRNYTFIAIRDPQQFLSFNKHVQFIIWGHTHIGMYMYTSHMDFVPPLPLIHTSIGACRSGPTRAMPGS